MSARRPAAARKPKLGRPVGVDSDITRARILLVARTTFAELGYAATTFRILAERVGLAPSALFNYFDSKAELYAAVHDDVKLEVYAAWILPAIEGTETFADRLDALLSSFIPQNSASPEVAPFLASARIDTARQPELSGVRGGLVAQRSRLLTEMIELGIETGEIDPTDRDVVAATLDTVIVGLLDVGADAEQHRLAIEGFRRTLRAFLRA